MPKILCEIDTDNNTLNISVNGTPMPHAYSCHTEKVEGEDEDDKKVRCSIGTYIKDESGMDMYGHCVAATTEKVERELDNGLKFVRTAKPSIQSSLLKILRGTDEQD